MHIYMASSGGDQMLPVEKRFGAIEPYVYGLSKELSRENVVEVFAYGEGEERTRNLHIRTFTFSPWAIRCMRPLFSKYFSLQGVFFCEYLLKEVVRVHKRMPVDVLHVHNTIPAPIAEFCRLTLDIPAVCSVHSYYRPTMLLRMFDKLLPVSEHMKRFLCGEKGIDASKVDVLPIAIDLKEWSPNGSSEKAKKELGLQGREIILFVGRKCPEKGPEVLIEALPTIIKRNPDVIAILLGSDYWHNTTETSFTQYLIARAKDLGIERNIVFRSWVDEEVLKQFYCAADVFVMPSVWQEPFGKVVIEAMACERAVVASRVGGIPEIISYGKDGLLVTPNDPADLAEAIMLVLNDADLAKSLGRAGRETVEKRFSFEAVAYKCLKIYNSLNGLNG